MRAVSGLDQNTVQCCGPDCFPQLIWSSNNFSIGTCPEFKTVQCTFCTIRPDIISNSFRYGLQTNPCAKRRDWMPGQKLSLATHMSSDNRILEIGQWAQLQKRGRLHHPSGHSLRAWAPVYDTALEWELDKPTSSRPAVYFDGIASLCSMHRKAPG